MKSYYAFKYQFRKVFKIENFDGCGLLRVAVGNKGSENRSGAVGAFGTKPYQRNKCVAGYYGQGFTCSLAFCG
jgi:hypothetical protein